MSQSAEPHTQTGDGGDLTGVEAASGPRSSFLPPDWSDHAGQKIDLSAAQGTSGNLISEQDQQAERHTRTPRLKLNSI